MSSTPITAIGGLNIILKVPLKGATNKSMNVAAHQLVKSVIQQEDEDKDQNLMGNIEFVKQIRSGTGIHVVFASETPPTQDVALRIQHKLQLIGEVYLATQTEVEKKRSADIVYKARKEQRSSVPSSDSSMRFMQMLIDARPDGGDEDAHRKFIDNCAETHKEVSVLAAKMASKEEGV